MSSLKVLSVGTFIFTQNTFSFVLLCGLAPLMLAFRPIIRYLFPVNDKFYDQMALKIQEKRRARRHLLKS